MLALFVFNTVGYKLWFYVAQQKSNQQLELAFDKNDYNSSELITIKVPLSLPYMSNQTSFERVDGEINIRGKIYKYVKRKIYNGALVLMCLPDKNKMRLLSAKDEFFKYANNLLNSSSKKSGSNTVFPKIVLSKYYNQSNEWKLTALFINRNSYTLHKPYYFPAGTHNTPEQPPDFS